MVAREKEKTTGQVAGVEGGFGTNRESEKEMQNAVWRYV